LKNEEPVVSIVDDDLLVREAIGDLVNSLGYEAITFKSAEDFLRSGQLARTACVIADLQMPGLSGLDLLERLLTDGYNTIRVILVTAYPRPEARERAFNSGAIAFLSKPFEEMSLINAVRLALQPS
jgi:FixJ family two-component response regulator